MLFSVFRLAIRTAEALYRSANKLWGQNRHEELDSMRLRGYIGYDHSRTNIIIQQMASLGLVSQDYMQTDCEYDDLIFGNVYVHLVWNEMYR